jgi:hypothetical protein
MLDITESPGLFIGAESVDSRLNHRRRSHARYSKTQHARMARTASIAANLLCSFDCWSGHHPVVMVPQRLLNVAGSDEYTAGIRQTESLLHQSQ